MLPEAVCSYPTFTCIAMRQTVWLAEDTFKSMMIAMIHFHCSSIEVHLFDDASAFLQSAYHLCHEAKCRLTSSALLEYITIANAS